MGTIINTTLVKAVGVRYFVNPALSQGADETPEMEQRTIAKLQWLDEVRPVLVLTHDTRNLDPNAVLVRAMGEPIARIDRNQAYLIRQMLSMSPNGMLTTTIANVVISRHGFFFLNMKINDCIEALNAAETTDVSSPSQVMIGIDWSPYHLQEMLLLPRETYAKREELSMTIYTMLKSDLKAVSSQNLRLYFDLYMQAVRFNQSREAHMEMLEMIGLLANDERPEVQQIAIDLDHLCTKQGTHELLNAMATEWWEPMLASPEVTREFAIVVAKCQNDRAQLLQLLDATEEMMRTLPGELYIRIDKANAFFAQLNYLLPPLKALRGVLSMFALRTLLCRYLQLPLDPFYGKRYAPISNVLQMPTTIGKVLEFAQKQCREECEVVTIQRLAIWLRDDYEQHHSKEIDEVIDLLKPATNVIIGNVNGSVNGSVNQQFDPNQKLLK